MHTFDITLQEERFAVAVADDGTLHVNGKPIAAVITQTGQHCYSVLMGGRSFTVVARKDGELYDVQVRGVTAGVQVDSERARLLKKYGAAAAAGHRQAEVHAPMPALVVKVEVAVGDEVHQGQGLLILEAMKMENEIKAHRAGRVKQILVQRGDAVEKGELLLVLE